VTLILSRNRKAAETSNLVETQRCTRVTRKAKVKVTGNENVKIVLRAISSSKVDQFTSNQDQNDQRPNTWRSRSHFHYVGTWGGCNNNTTSV